MVDTYLRQPVEATNQIDHSIIYPHPPAMNKRGRRKYPQFIDI